MLEKLKSFTKNILISFCERVKRTLICFDQLLNVIVFNGYEDETLSSRFYRWSLKDPLLWKLPSFIVDTLFFFDCQYIYDGSNMSGRKAKHCEKSFINELNRTGFPERYRNFLAYQKRG